MNKSQYDVPTPYTEYIYDALIKLINRTKIVLNLGSQSVKQKASIAFENTYNVVGEKSGRNAIRPRSAIPEEKSYTFIINNKLGNHCFTFYSLSISI